MSVKHLGDSTTYESSGPRDITLLGNYTVLNTVGTSTITCADGSNPGAFLGFYCVSPGTSFTAVAYDIVGTNTVTLISTATSTAGQWTSAAGPDIGVRVQGQLVTVTSGTAGQYNAIWD